MTLQIATVTMMVRAPKSASYAVAAVAKRRNRQVKIIIKATMPRQAKIKLMTVHQAEVSEN